MKIISVDTLREWIDKKAIQIVEQCKTKAVFQDDLLDFISSNEKECEVKTHKAGLLITTKDWDDISAIYIERKKK